MKSNEEFKQWVEEKVELRSKHLKRFFNHDPSDIHRVYGYRNFHSDCHIIATYNLILGNAAEARRYYGEAALFNHQWVTLVERHFDDLDPEMTYQITLDLQATLYRAIMAGDPEIISTVAPDAIDFDRSVMPRLESFPEREPRVRALAGLMIEDEEVARSNLDDLNEVLNEHDKPFDEPFATAMEGLLEDDPDLVHDGTTGLVEYHEEVVDEPGAVDEEMAAPAAALIRLADHRGIHVDVESLFIPDALWSLEWGPLDLPDEVYDALNYVDL